MIGQARSELTDQAQVQQARVATGLHSIADQLRTMATDSSEQGAVADLTHQAAEKTREVANFFENRDPGGVLDEVRAFARKRPGAFLALALGAGVVAGRLARGIAADPDEGASPAQQAALNGGRERPALAPSQRTLPAAPVTGEQADWSSSWSDGR